MNWLCTDIGNTRLKTGLYVGDELADSAVFLHSEVSAFCDWVRGLPVRADAAVLSAVCDVPLEVEQAMRDASDCYERLSASTPLPIRNLYKSPGTLGMDRLAAAVGAFSLYPDRNLLVVDAGTAVTFDLVTADGAYHGGTISPGLTMRFKALHQYAAQLPELSVSQIDGLFGQTTEEAITYGVQNGIYGEIAYYLEQYGSVFESMTVVLTGGDAQFLLERLKNTTKSAIFAHQDLVMHGLSRIACNLHQQRNSKNQSNY